MHYVIDGEEVDEYTYFERVQIHEMKPVKFGGSPISIDNKIALLPKEHAKYTAYWNRILREEDR